MKIAESPLGDWVKWDTGQTVTAYARRMMGGNYWGGGIEIACCVRMKKVNIHVYEARHVDNLVSFAAVSALPS